MNKIISPIMKRFPPNYLILGTLFCHIFFWLVILLLNQGQTVQITTFLVDSNNLTDINLDQLKNLKQIQNKSSLVYSTGFITFYWFLLFLIPRHRDKSLVVFILLALLSVVFMSLVDMFIADFQIEGRLESEFDVQRMMQLLIFKWILFSHGVWALAAWFCYTVYIKVKQNLDTKEKHLESTQTELALLKQQIQPHFLFNVLNCLYSSAYNQGAETTAEGIGKLSDILRYMLYETNSDKVRLNQELTYIKNYIDLQLLRFEADVNVEFSSLSDDFNFDIAPMLLIVLVENAFKHGVIPGKKSTIKINLVVEHNELCFEVLNHINPKMATALKKNKVGGLGLVNLQRRLALLYDNKHDLFIDTDDNMFTARLILR